MEERYVGEILVRQGALTPERLEQALSIVDERGSKLKDVLAGAHILEEAQYVEALARDLGLPVITKISVDEIPAELIDLVPINFARQHELLPLSISGDVLRVAIANPLDLSPLDDLRALSGKRCEPVVVSSEVIEAAINRVYERKDQNSLAESDSDDDVDELQDLIDMTDEAPVIRWVNNLFYESVRDRASDIHIEPADNEVVVRYRIDGTLYKVKAANKAFLSSIVARVKIEANLNIAEKRLPQDGRITKKIKGKLVDVRVSTIPTNRGERIVLRLLDKEQALLDLPALGFDRDQMSVIEDLITRPNGILLVTGPTGAGKTTTLYACLNKINSPELNILTVEDPVEYELRGISQMPVQPKIGLTFAAGLRSFLRQDPDVIMVGEIRDHETAEIAIHASLTGHLVFSTLHTNDAAGAIARMVEMGVQPFLIASSLLAVLAQRLVRRLCNECRQPYVPSDQDLRSLELDAKAFGPPLPILEGQRPPGSIPPAALGSTGTKGNGSGNGHDSDIDDEITLANQPLAAVILDNGTPSKAPRPVFYRPVGCEQCAGTGYRGRVGIYELLVVDEPIRRDILNNSDSKTITRTAQERGMITLRVDGTRQVLAGKTSVEEVLAMTQAGDLE
ncbi:MAG TPA: ATPase, T2SS/T4P/T4SS family [Polyangiales bacterium]|nr:ATPase, T2SS/T4P/T4SS family [Polyangiales bacterium]